MPRSVLSNQGGFALPAVLLLLLISGITTTIAFMVVTGDTPIAKADQNRRTAFDAAQAGVSWYASRLAADPDYWTNCANVPDPDGGTTPPVLDRAWDGTGSDPRSYRAVPGTSGAGLERYTIELLPAAGSTRCDPANPGASMLTSNRLRIRSTGVVGSKRRSIIATFKRPSFLDYVYFTNYEVLDPDALPPGASGSSVNCKRYYTGTTNRQGNGCQEIQWATGDSVAGPLHTNDQLNINGNPVFGDQATDRIEVSDPAVCRGTSNCADSSRYVGTLVKNAAQISRPPDNRSLEALTDAGYRFAGSTQFVLGATTFRYRNASTFPSWRTLNYPTNGLIWVTNTSGSCPPSTIYQKYDFSDIPCGNAYVSGTYGKNVTIAASNDIIVTDDLQRTDGSTAMAGLVANNYVRLFHPVNFASGATTCNSSNANSTTTPKYYVNGTGYDVIERQTPLPWQNPTIEAGILAVNHSWIVDNYPCGSPLGDLNVQGAIAQEFRGPVAQSSGTTVQTGYVKKYTYDRRFAYRQPPNFLEPSRAAWFLARQSEQVPAR